MGHLYFVRHGESEWNVANKICGATDIPLTDQGRIQAKMTADQINEMGIQARMILYSPLIRASETAEIISARTGIPCMEEKRLMEQNFGRFEGTERDGRDFYEAKKQFVYRYDGGESMMQTAHRIYNLIDEIKTEENTYILVAHNGIARILHSYFYDMSNDEFSEFGIQNCEIREYRWD